MKRLLKVFYEYWIKPWAPYEENSTDNTRDMGSMSSKCYF